MTREDCVDTAELADGEFHAGANLVDLRDVHVPEGDLARTGVRRFLRELGSQVVPHVKGDDIRALLGEVPGGLTTNSAGTARHQYSHSLDRKRHPSCLLLRRLCSVQLCVTRAARMRSARG